ncbi:hypothetical protein Ngar_c20650 [Candidatus Nitrososphaera gargensis Ga9.2]|uniref:Uncharacterized protein n=2 Tax=Candidatus Nitrososphaera gargensis TaxID=497727 RepID=K0IKK2_NITGG|nr:hypothetical protein Ngar_c20650 [Candidatus Nitrososphaera gargensis Ga9.2]
MQVILGMVVSDKEVVRRSRETIEFLKVESIGGVWNTPQLIDMLEDLFKEDSKIYKNKER